MGFLILSFAPPLLTSLQRRKINLKLIGATDEFTPVLDQYSIYFATNKDDNVITNCIVL